MGEEREERGIGLLSGLRFVGLWSMSGTVCGFGGLD